MVKYFTGIGDNGTTGLLGEGRVKKYDLRMETLGTLDELSAVLGFSRSICEPEISDLIKKIQGHLYEIMSEIAATKDNQPKYRKMNESSVKFLEKAIDQFSNEITNPQGFILPGDTQAAAALSMSRAVCRRAERRMVELFDNDIIENNFVGIYLNRLSSLLFVLEVKESSSTYGKLSMARESHQ